MTQSFMNRIAVLGICLVICLAGSAQKKLLVLGSSTSACYGPSSYENCYLGRLQQHYQNTGAPFTIENRAIGGSNVYQGMPTGYNPPSGRDAPWPDHNITTGLQGNPDVVLINYPSNGYDIFSVDEVLFCLRMIKATANGAGKPCYITTTQPRSDPASYRTPAVRSKMAEIKERVLNEFGPYAINFWDGIVNPADNSILSAYDADGTHLNNAGHNILFNRVLEKNIFSQPTPPPPPPVDPGNGLNFRYYEGDWNALPDFNAMSPVKSGQTANIDLGARNRNDHYGFVWEGKINITTPGNYTFELVSDDGSKFYFNTTYSSTSAALVQNDGLHPAQSAYGSIAIPSAGAYPVAIAFFEKNGGETMELYWSGPGFGRQPVPNAAFTSGGNPTPGGLSFKYYEGDWNSLPDFNSLSPVKTGSMGNVELGARNRDDHYAFLWEGRIDMPAAGNYTFELVSDDGSKLYFNTQYAPDAGALVNNDGLHPAQSAYGNVQVASAGSYPIAITFFERDGGETMELYWTVPGMQRQRVPASAFSPTSTGGGLAYRYYEGLWNSLPDFSSLSPVKTGNTADLSLEPRNRNDHFGFVWEGSISIPVAGEYTFELVSDDGSKLYFNSNYAPGSNALVNNDGLHPAQSAYGTTYVPAAGAYPFAVSFFEKDGGETMEMYWSGPGFSRQRIPATAFSASSYASSMDQSLDKSAEKNINASIIPNQNTDKLAVRTYPNPFRDRISISLVNPANSGNIHVELFDNAGKMVHRQDFRNMPAGATLLQVNPQKKLLAKGIYFLKLNLNGHPSRVIKLVNERNR